MPSDHDQAIKMPGLGANRRPTCAIEEGCGAALMFKQLLITMALLVPTASHAKDEAKPSDSAKVVARSIDKFIRPGYARFHGDMVMLKTAMDDLCTTPGPTAFAEVREDFAAAVASWSAIGVIRLGPITEDNRLARVLSWPDPQATAMEQVKAAIAGHDKALTDAKALTAKNPALQGLTALEYVLYGENSKDLRGSGGSFRCHYGAAIAENVETIAEKVQEEWDNPKGFRAEWTAPGPQNPIYHDEKQMLGSLVAQFADALQTAQATRLGGLSSSGGNFLFDFSHNTFQSLDAELDGLRLLFQSSKLAALLQPKDKWIGDSIAFEFRNAHDTLAPLIRPNEKPVNPAEQQKVLAQINGIMGRLSGLFAVKLPQALGVATGTATLERG
jgi:uncharacterized protein